MSSSSNGPRQDWLVCPLRALDPVMISDVVRRLFRIDASERIWIAPGPRLTQAGFRKEFEARIVKGERSFVYLQSKLGGEISIPQTDASPELSFDTTIVEVVRASGRFQLSRYGIFEMQTMDYHGSYRSVVENLTQALRLHKKKFHSALGDNTAWLSENMEGPNKANVFKRTFYQMMLKFQIAADETCAGCVLALPSSVWDSWQRHLGKPRLLARQDGTFALSSMGVSLPERVPAWIYVFDIDASATPTPNRLVLKQVIATNAEAVSHFALKVAPAAAAAGVGSSDRVLGYLRTRILEWWPAI